MALFKILKGKSANLPANKVNGYCYVTTDEHKLYVDYTKDDETLDRFALNAVSADQWKTARNLNGMVVNGTSNVVNYGTCSTAAATTAKVVSCSNFALITGAEITVKFTTTNTAANPTLNVNSTGAKAIHYRGSAISAEYLAANRTYTFRYNGSQYELVGDINTNTDTKVTQTVTTSDAAYPLLLAPNGQTTTTTTNAYFDSGVTLNPSTNTIAANISGNAATATKATQDGNGNIISSTYLPLTGGTMTGTLTIDNGNSAGSISISEDGEGGTIRLYSKNGTYCYEMDSYNDEELRIHTASEHPSDVSFKSIQWSGKTGALTADSFIGNASSATKLATARPIFGQFFDGTAEIAGKAVVYGTYTSTPNNRYGNSAIEIRENGLVLNTQSDIGYAPSIGFHWGNTTAGTMLLHSDGNFYLRGGDGTTRATLDANLNGNAATAGTAINANWLNVNSTLTYGASGLNYFNISGSADGAANTNGTPTADWYHIIRMNHANGNGYYFDIASCFHNNNMYFKRVASGSSSGWQHIWVQGNSVTGAVWNDYAECRESDCKEFGYVLTENGDDTLTKTTERLQPFAGVSSDTWGFSQGETEKAKTPIAVAGRVLVYTYQDRSNYKPGDCVCAAPGGTVDIMTREEVREWPDRIVGTVSCVPNYEEWGGGEGADRDPVKVNGRIWIRVV